MKGRRIARGLRFLTLALLVLVVSSCIQPATASSPIGGMNTARFYRAATLLPDHKVSIAGGRGSPGSAKARSSSTGTRPSANAPAATNTPTATATPASMPSPTATPVPQLIVITASGANPPQVTVSSGTPVQFTNRDDIAHVVTANDGSFGPLYLPSGVSTTVVLTATVTYTVTYTIDKVTNPTGSIVVLGTGGSPTPTPSPTATPVPQLITITAMGANPQVLTVPSGAPVEFINDDDIAHVVTSDDGSFGPLDLAIGGSATIVLTAAGTHGYTIDRVTNPTGSIVVIGGGGSPTPTPSPTNTPTPAPSLTVNPNSGYFGQTIVFTGTGFGPTELVNLYANSVGGTPIYSSTTDATGLFVLTTTVLQGPIGPHLVIAVGQTSGLTATTTFTIVPTASLAYPSGPQRSIDVLTGYGFGAREAVTAYWTSRRGPVLGTTITSGYGTFAGSAAITFTVPLSPTGSYSIISVGWASGAVVTSTFTLMPSLSITPADGKPGSNATVSGMGYGAHEAVTVRWNCASPTCTSTTLLGAKDTDAHGNFSGLQVTIPSPATRGPHAVGGKGGTTNAFADTFYKIT